ncbi:hypothetical protein H0S70_13340 [Chryseobacterium manosquense]|uniref:Uncharacterized protein n=1 Tax=Chryseobacterium manosquense TaxID=2754694 RepID=A0A7H1DWD0_9FLAO|nr:hypothetical protein [Chryseobacterium manosquense]QNS41288.1 hypothetical protein H0S70_13340 [Chryseobacterium manosquense]
MSSTIVFGFSAIISGKKGIKIIPVRITTTPTTAYAFLKYRNITAVFTWSFLDKGLYNSYINAEARPSSARANMDKIFENRLLTPKYSADRYLMKTVREINPRTIPVICDMKPAQMLRKEFEVRVFIINPSLMFLNKILV